MQDLHVQNPSRMMNFLTVIKSIAALPSKEK
jgi:hypothetical protein